MSDLSQIERSESPPHKAPIDKLRRREEYRFFATLPRASKSFTWAWWLLIVSRGVLPGLFTVAVASVVTAVSRQASLVGPLVAAGAVFMAIQISSPLHGQLSANLGERLSRWLHDRLLVAATGPAGVAHLESREMTDRLISARDFDLGIAGPPMHLTIGMIAGGMVQVVSGLGQAVVLARYSWWAPLLIGGAWASTHWLLRESSIWGDRDEGDVLTAQRRAEYAYRQAVDSAAAKELRLFGLSEWTVSQFAASRRKLVDLRWQATRLRRKPLPWTIALLVAANSILLWSLARDAIAGSISIGEVVLFVSAAIGTSALAFGGLSWALPPAAHSVATALDLEVQMAAAGHLTTGDGSADGLPRESLRFRQVGFTYPGSNRTVLDGLDLTIEAGTSLAVVGLNGAGKTTLAKLVCGLLQPTAGAVEADGVDLRDLDVRRWRQRVSAVFQDFIRYEMPLWVNVAPLGAPDEMISEALADAGADQLTGLDTPLGRGYEGGTDLSGGQWQRVAVARALRAVRQGAGVVVLDEPTAQLDVKGESEIFERILQATRGCTTLLISHRFTTVRHADRICVLEAGRVAELGTHDELMALNGQYRKMFDLQASRFLEGESDEPA
jgi:ABC-type multidrug transport system fused ATPase/permease subunit